MKTLLILLAFWSLSGWAVKKTEIPPCDESLKALNQSTFAPTPHLSKEQHTAFIEPSTGLFIQLAQNLPGYSEKMDEAILKFAEQRISDPTVLQAAISRIKSLGIKKRDGISAKDGNKRAAERVHRALQIIAECRNSKPATSLFTEVDGIRELGLPTIRPQFSEEEHQAFIDEVDGILVQAMRSLPGLSHYPERTLLALAEAQIADPSTCEVVKEKIRLLGIKKKDGVKAKERGKRSAERIQQALRIIAEHKLGSDPGMLLTQQKGTEVFGWKKVEPKVTPELPPRLSEPERQAFVDPKKGMLAHLFRTLKGFSYKADQLILKYATEQIPDPQRREQAITRIKALGIRPADGNFARSGGIISADRLHAALVIIANAREKTETPSVLTQQVGKRVLAPSAISPLSEVDAQIFTDRRQGLLPQMMRQINKFGYRTDKAVLRFARAQIASPTAADEAIREITALEIKSGDGSGALAGNRRSAERLVAAFRIIAEKKNGSVVSRLLTAQDGVREFELVPLSFLSNVELSTFIDRKNGLLARVAEDIRGFKSYPERELYKLVEEQISGKKAQQRAIIMIQKLNIRPNDGRLALEGNLPAAERLQTAFQIIAKEKLKADAGLLLTAEKGSEIFGWR